MKKWTWVGFVGACALSCGSSLLAGETTWTQVGPNAGSVSVQFSANPSIAFALGGDLLLKA